MEKARYHLPGLFEFYDFYKEFLPLFFEHRDWFYDWCEIGSIYGAPADCIWGGGRVGYGENEPEKVRNLMRKFGISARLTFSNSLITKEHLTDKLCNKLCGLFDNGEEPHNGEKPHNGVIVSSPLLMKHIHEHYPSLYFVSSTTKVITDFSELLDELACKDYSYVVPDFRFNNKWDKLTKIPEELRRKTEFLCNECCDVNCADRKKCYENVSRKALGENCPDHICRGAHGKEGYLFSRAMESPAFIGTHDILEKYIKEGFREFKIEGRSLGSAILLEFILYYMTKPEHQLKVREKIYLDSMLDLF